MDAWQAREKRHREWLENLKEGDKIAITRPGWGGGYELAKVAKLTKTQIVLENGTRYRRADGRRTGEYQYGQGSLCEYNDEVKQWLLAERAGHKFRELTDELKNNRKNFTLEELEELNSTLTAFFAKYKARLTKGQEAQV